VVNALLFPTTYKTYFSSLPVYHVMVLTSRF